MSNRVVGKSIARGKYVYPMQRLPPHYSDIIGVFSTITRAIDGIIIHVVQQKTPINYQKCEGEDSNPRIPAKLDPKSSAFDLARQPSRS